jgi:hypothetical protein
VPENQHIQQQRKIAGIEHVMAEELIITCLVNKCNNWFFILLIFFIRVKQLPAGKVWALKKLNQIVRMSFE